MTKIKFETSQYCCSHGKEPRGLGCWAFQITHEDYRMLRSAEADKRLPGRPIQLSSFDGQCFIFKTGGSCSLSEAKRIVRDLYSAAGSTGHHFVKVAP